LQPVCHPESLSVAKKYDVLGWTEPERLHAAIRQISNLNTPTELLAKAPASRDSLSVDELDLIVNRFQLVVCTSGTSRHYMWIHVPGHLEARTLVSAEEAVDDDLFMGLWKFSITDESVKAKRVAKFLQDNPDPVPLPPMAKDEHQYNLASSHDEILRGDDHCWPPLRRRRLPERYLPTAFVVLPWVVRKREFSNTCPWHRSSKTCGLNYLRTKKCTIRKDPRYFARQLGMNGTRTDDNGSVPDPVLATSLDYPDDHLVPLVVRKGSFQPVSQSRSA
jgi:hypothetical protein